MKVVIDIPKEEYELCKRQCDTECLDTLMIAVKYGTPLPKGHGRLIDANVLQMEMDKDIRKAMSFVDLKDFVWLAPTIVEADKEDDK